MVRAEKMRGDKGRADEGAKTLEEKIANLSRPIKDATKCCDL